MGSQSADIIALLEGISHTSFKGDEVERLRVRAAARRLLARVESPHERAWGFCFEQPVVFAALQTCIDLGLWKAWTSNGGGEKTIDQLVNFTTRPEDVEPELLRRFFRLLAAFNVVEEIGPDTFRPTPFSLAIGDESTKVRASLEAANNQYILAGHNLPRYLAKIGYKVPVEVVNNNHSGSDPDGLNFFGRLQASPKCYADFTGHMETWTLWKTPWTKLHDPAKLVEGAKLDDGIPLVVDVGGNTGIDITHVLNAQPDLPAGALVLQDLPEMIAKAKAIVDPKITAMAHDFFTPQPVKGARAYFMHAVLHDWPDEKATQLLQNTRDAMVKGYSKLFVYDIVLPPTGASISQTTMDVNMMSLLSASERTKSQWEKLLNGAGFRIVNFWPDPQEYEMLIEAEVV
ncbi:S-adenosyl-L-methionine-dependent methyltransferase [Coniochaeta sp. 2T2.1]|nr:S-adenosyl-L-methionine-dependent methyltransferase [Coniochaeta sp. 2T2.1]